MNMNITITGIIKLVGLCCLGLFAQTQVQAACECDSTVPFISIDAPTQGSSYSSEKSTITLSGQAGDDTGLDSVSWFSDSGAHGMTTATTSWESGVYDWQAKAIPLTAETTVITVMAVDTSGNEASATLTVTYNPSPPAVSSEASDIGNRKTKITVWVPDSYTNLDRFTMGSLLQDNPDKTFQLPFDSDVTISARITDPSSGNLPLFTYTIPAGTVDSGVSTYRYRRPGSENSGSGIRELEFDPRRGGKTYMYLYVNNDNFLTAKKNNMSDTEFKTFLRLLESYTVTVEANGKTWTGIGRLYSAVYDRKAELTENR